MKRPGLTIVLTILTSLSLAGFAVNAHPQERPATTQTPEAPQPGPLQEPLPRWPKRIGAGLQVVADLTVAPLTYSGPCPASVTLKGYISVNEATSAQYRFIRSNSIPTEPITLTFEKPERREVSTVWHIGSSPSLSAFSETALLEVIYPLNRKIQSNAVVVKGACTSRRPPTAELLPAAQRDTQRVLAESLPSGPVLKQGPLAAELPSPVPAGKPGVLPAGPFPEPPAGPSIPTGKPDVSPTGPFPEPPTGRGPTVPGDISCVTFNPSTATILRTGGTWTVVDGPLELFSFALDKIEAENALAIVKHYNMDQSCFLGGPAPSFHYMLAGGSAPVGSFRGEDCGQPFDPATISVQQIKDSWKLVDGTKALFDFGPKKNEADQALAIVKKHGFTRSCMMARGKVYFLYFRK
jgi:hypothetical protein